MATDGSGPEVVRPSEIAVSGLLVIGLIQAGPAGAARFVAQVPWAASGPWVAVDTHVHTTFSDGASTVEDVVERARQFGCQGLAITDHADRALGAATPEYRAAIEAARTAHAGFPILAGLEWNVPPRGGDEHATVLVSPGAESWATLAEFKRRFDDFDLAPGRQKPNVGEALAWLAAQGGDNALVIDNHPSRRDGSSMDNVQDMLGWRAVNRLVIGFEGAPGHQGHEPIGSYQSSGEDS